MTAGCAAALAARAAFAQAVLPTSYTGPWQGYEPPSGWIFSGLGSPDYGPDYDGYNDGAAKLDDTGDFISIHYDLPAAAVSFWIRGLTFSGGTFRVEESVDGAAWTELAAYAPPPTNATFQTLEPSLHSRHLRFIYSARVTGNVGIDGISIAKSPFYLIERFETSNGVGRVWISTSDASRLYGLQHTTNLAMNPVPWVQVSSAWGNGGELELIDFAVAYPRYYRVLDVTPPPGKTVLPARAKTPWRGAAR